MIRIFLAAITGLFVAMGADAAITSAADAVVNPQMEF